MLGMKTDIISWKHPVSKYKIVVFVFYGHLGHKLKARDEPYQCRVICWVSHNLKCYTHRCQINKAV